MRLPIQRGLLFLWGLTSGGCQPAGVSVPALDDDRPAEAERPDSGVEFIPGTSAADPGVVINELHIDPDLKTIPSEFVELVNSSDERIDLGGWMLCDGVSYAFPEGTSLAVGGHVVVALDPDTLAESYDVDPAVVFGPFQGHLDNDGETLSLCDGTKARADEVDYQQGFPWPTVGDAVPADDPGSGHSFQLAHPELDNDLAGSWRSAFPTPGGPNLEVYAADIAPQLRQLSHEPQAPASGETVTVTVKATDPQGVASVTLQLQVVEPGAYVRHQYSDGNNNRIDDPDYQEGWVALPMNDAGSDGDAVAADDIYSVVVPASVQQHRRLVRYQITATDAGGNPVQVPYDDDPQPNFAYFVYDGVPAWSGADRPEVTGVVEYDAEVMSALPTYHLLARAEDVSESQYAYIDYMSDEAGWYQWTGALVYDGVVYDHIWFRNRGWWSAYEWGKNKWKFDFNRGHDFQARGRDGIAYEQAFDKMNYSACVLPVDYNPHRGEQGMFEAVAFRLFQLVGVPAPNTHWIHFRIIDAAEEATAEQWEGDFWGLYLVIEQPDGNFLDERGLPDGNLFKMAGTTPHEWTSPTNQGPTHPTDMSDLWDFIDAYQSSQDEVWWEENTGLEGYFSYRAIVEALHHFDLPDGWNSVYYHLPETWETAASWWMLPWDVDLTWDCCIYSNDTEQWQQVMGRFPEQEARYINRAREIRDLLVNDDEGHRLIDELAAVIADPHGGPSFVQADRALWDYHPRNTRPGQYYTNPPGDFWDMVQYMKDFLTAEGWGGANLDNIAGDADIPATPVIRFIGGEGFSVTDLRFEADPFADPQGAGTFAAMMWRAGEVGEGRYEIEAVWESEELTVFESTVTVPADAVEVGRTYRVRVRMQDDSRRWSHWSLPIEFEPTWEGG